MNGLGNGDKEKIVLICHQKVLEDLKMLLDRNYIYV